MKHHIQMAKYDSLKFINEAFFTVLMIGVSSLLAVVGPYHGWQRADGYLCFNQLIKPLEELHRILDELSECTILAGDFFAMLDLPSDFSYRMLPEAASRRTGRFKHGAAQRCLFWLRRGGTFAAPSEPGDSQRLFPRHCRPERLRKILSHQGDLQAGAGPRRGLPRRQGD